MIIFQGPSHDDIDHAGGEVGLWDGRRCDDTRNVLKNRMHDHDNKGDQHVDKKRHQVHHHQHDDNKNHPAHHQVGARFDIGNNLGIRSRGCARHRIVHIVVVLNFSV